MDAAWDADLNSCGLTIVIRDPSRVIVGGSSRFDFTSSPLATEALAIELGLNAASSLSLSSLHLESDSLTLISALQNPLSTVDWTAAQIVTRIRALACRFIVLTGVGSLEKPMLLLIIWWLPWLYVGCVLLIGAPILPPP
ncbi:hypothetical protein RchiOBHm_Chr3g0490691 [Rosa chinensis]|uniref:RNase H type-1 domain-containing protein n=1 Tax=Rosa chinensis TaxID=74649 RepID=A0A2P6RG15_ROSCH|nr:hypothetical protein RchiOBHm_Chr3g0490691 [Rosa chinensis]